MSEAPSPAGHSYPLTGAPAKISNKHVAVPATVEWDHKGRVCKSRFQNGQVCQFRYDQQGSLYAFTYAKMAWSTTDGARWSAVDQENTYTLDGSVDISIDGTIRVRRPGVLRILALNGMITDEFQDGTRVESARSVPDLMPTDLLAVIRRKNTDTLTRLTTYRPEDQVDEGRESRGNAPPLPPAAKEAGRTPGPVDSAPLAPPPQAPHRKVIAQGVRINRRSAVTARLEDRPPETDFRAIARTLIARLMILILGTVRGADHSSVAKWVDMLACKAYEQRRLDEARLLHERCLQIRRRSLGVAHHDVGLTLYWLGKIYFDWGRLNEAEQYWLEAVQLLDNGLRKSIFLFDSQAVGDDFVVEHLMRLTDVLFALASLYHQNRQLKLCQQIFDAAQHVCSKVSPSQASAVASTVAAIRALSKRLDESLRQRAAVSG